MLFHFLAQPAGGPERFILGQGRLELGHFDLPLFGREGFRGIEVLDFLLEGEIPVPESGVLPILFRGDRQAVLVLDEQELFGLAERFLLGRAQRVFRDFRGGQDSLIYIPQEIARVRRREQTLDGPVHDPRKVRPLIEEGYRRGGILLKQESQAFGRKDELKVQRKTEELVVSGVVDLLDFGIDRQ